MFETTSLTKDDYLKNISLVVSDIDYTLVNFLSGHNSAIKTIREETGEEFSKAVDDIYQIIIEERMIKDFDEWNKKDEYIETVGRIKKLSSRKWSRESWIIIAAEKLGVKITKEEIETFRDIYWETVGKSSTLYEDTKAFLNMVSEKNIPLILMTSSDGVMKVQEDLSLIYNPEFSKETKEKRVKLLPIRYSSLVIGDPIDKPDIEFFRIIEKEIEKFGKFKKNNILFIGDSLKIDVAVPEKLGYQTLLIKRARW